MSNTTVKLQTHRFLFSDDVSDILMDFARIHQYDERKTYKEAWQNLLKDEETMTILSEEISKIQQNGYDGDVLDKMFKSTRYYYRKKLIKESNQITVEKSPRKEYETMDYSILEDMDRHIKQEIASQMSPATNSETLVSRAAPSKSFEKYYIEYKNGNLNQAEDVEKEKLKKTYKNRFYKIRVKLMS